MGYARPMIRQIEIRVAGRGMHEITSEIVHIVDASGIDEGLCTLFVRHTSASLTIQENADPDVQRDLDAFFKRLVPDTDDPSMAYLRHRAEGPDDMPAHIKAALTQTSLSIPVSGGRMALGTWQGLYLFEHRTQPHTRRVVAHLSR